MPSFTSRSLPKLQPSSIDERIRKVCQGLPINAVLKYLPRAGSSAPPPIHPDYVCWYNSCENLADWTFHADVDPSIDTSDYKENVGSLFLDVPKGAVSYPSASLDIDWCDVYAGCWAQIAKTRYVEEIRLIRAGDNYMSFYTTIYNTWAYNYRVDGVSYSHDSGVSCLPLGTWFWLEVHNPPGYVTKTFRINGTAGWAAIREDIGTPTLFQAICNRETGVDHAIKVDYVRVADRWEYPPA